MTKSKSKPKVPFTPDWKSIGIGVVAGIILITIIGLAGGRVEEWSLLGIKFGFPENPDEGEVDIAQGSVSLASVSYEQDDWNPRVIDLRTAGESGIPVSPGHSLRLFDFVVYVPNDVTNYVVLAAIYGNDELIGLTEGQLLGPGMNKLGDVEVNNYQHDTVENAWRIQNDWESLSIVLMVYIGENKVGSTSNTILLNPSGASWYITAPYASINSIVYQVNNGPELIADLRAVLGEGIPLIEGDELTIIEAWYQCDWGDEVSKIQFEAYISSGEYNSETLQISKEDVIKTGVHELLAYEEMRWIITEESKYLVMTLSRDSRTVLDRMVVPLSLIGNNSLLPNRYIIRWPVSNADYFSF